MSGSVHFREALAILAERLGLGLTEDVESPVLDEAEDVVREHRRHREQEFLHQLLP